MKIDPIENSNVQYPIRVLHINYKMQCAGIETYIMNIYRNIDREKVQFDFLVHYTERQFYDQEIEKLGGKIYRLSIREDNNFAKYFSELKKFFMRHTEYKIIHAHMESFALFYLPFAKKAKIPVIIAHSHNDNVGFSIKGFMKRIMNVPFRYLSTDLLADSEPAGKFMFGGYQFKVVKLGIDVKQFRYSEETRIGVRNELNINDKYVIGHAGRFNEQKNHIFLLELFSAYHKKNNRAVLVLLGEGELEKKIKERIQKLKLENSVIFLGVKKDLYKYYQAMDIFVFPSLYEGLGIVCIEAQASGLKVVASTGVPKEAKICENMSRISLQAPVDLWLKNIEDKGTYERSFSYKDILKAGYDIKNVALEMQSLYLKKYNESVQ